MRRAEVILNRAEVPFMVPKSETDRTHVGHQD